MSGAPESAGARPSVAVIGAGVSGLTVAFELLERSERLPGGIDLLCLDSADRAGGNVRTLRQERFLCEWGPPGFTDDSPATLTLVRRLGLQERVASATSAAGRRYVYRGGRLRAVPEGPRALLRSDLLPWTAKLRLLAEPFVRGRATDEDESVFDFASRRMGRGAAAVLADALVTGVFAGDARRLSLPAAFPAVHEMERRHGSVLRALVAQRGRTEGGTLDPRGRLTSFRDGMQELTDALAARLGGALRLGSRLRAVRSMGRRGFRMIGDSGPPRDVSAVVLACPAPSAAELVRDMDPGLSAAMSGISFAPVAVVHLGFREDSLGRRPDGFGFLVPRGQGLRILGTLWPSSIFEHRAPGGSVLMTTLVGGAHDAAALNLADGKLVQLVRSDLEKALGILAPPYLVEVQRHRRGIPQYEIGHRERVRAIDDRCRHYEGLFVCGSSYRGVSVNACIQEASEVAESVLAHLARREAA